MNVMMTMMVFVKPLTKTKHRLSPPKNKPVKREYLQLVHSELDDDVDDADPNNSNPLTRGIQHGRPVNFQHKSPTSKSISLPLGATWTSPDAAVPAARPSSDFMYVL